MIKIKSLMKVKNSSCVRKQTIKKLGICWGTLYLCIVNQQAS
jgi:hypothetical protein